MSEESSPFFFRLRFLPVSGTLLILLLLLLSLLMTKKQKPRLTTIVESTSKVTTYIVSGRSPPPLVTTGVFLGLPRPRFTAGVCISSTTSSFPCKRFPSSF